MRPDVTADDLASFLRDVVESTTRQQRTVVDQTKDGFALWIDEVCSLDGVRSPHLEQPDRAASTFLTVQRPGPEPTRPDSLGVEEDVDEDFLDGIRREHERWVQHRAVYDQLFAARTPPEAMELVLGSGLLIAVDEKGELRRHLVTAPAGVTLDRITGVLRVELSDAATAEVNWTPGEVRDHLIDSGGGLDELVEAQSADDVAGAVHKIAASFGAGGITVEDRTEPARAGVTAVGGLPALLLRRRDTSALLRLLRDMAEDMTAGGLVSVPFQMLTRPDVRPPERELVNDRAALPLPANNEQRAMIDRARSQAHMVVQGPPGTGKTHTIANLASVLMAEGRRVLITAENERALAEVQSKLPAPMQPLLLPMLRERGTGALQASVNALTTRAGSINTAEDRAEEIESCVDRLVDLEARITKASSQLRQVARADSEERTYGRTIMTVAGHQRLLAGESDRLELVDRFLGQDGHVAGADGETIYELSPIVDEAHRQMREYPLPEGLMGPGELGAWLQEHRGQMAVLGDPAAFDYAPLADRVDELARLAESLQSLPPTSWSELTRTSEEYAAAAEACAGAGGAVDHGVTVDPSEDRSAVVATLEAYLALDAARFDRPIDELLTQHEQAFRHADAAAAVGDLADPSRAMELTKACEQAIHLLTHDRSGLLASYVNDYRSHGRSQVDQIVVEAQRLLGGARAPMGLPVEIGEAAPPVHELLRQAIGLKAHLEGGGKLSKLVGTPRPVKEASELLGHVRVNGSVVDTVEEAQRVVEYLTHLNALALIDAWAQQHALQRPVGVARDEWIDAIAHLPTPLLAVGSALELVDELVSFPFGSGPSDPAALLQTALATVSQEVVASLGALATAAAQQRAELRVEGKPVRSRAEAQRAVAALQAALLRLRHAQLLPGAWAERCNPLDVDDDALVAMLEVCAAAVTVPSAARAAELTPSAVNRIAERAQFDARRHQLAADHQRVIGGLRRTLATCVPMSPATRALDEAIERESPTDYRVAMLELDHEREMADRASKLDGARARVERVHPRLLSEFDAGTPEAIQVVRSLDELQDLRDHRATVARWKAEIGSSEQIHQELARLHRELRRTESRLAELRCWSSAVGRLQSRPELRSSLSALTIAMDKVPKTRTAKSYPARMRALRSATKEAAPAIPCWVMTIERVAEVLGYPTGEDRFDVVIVDEASQAWFPAMFLYAIADQVIVVGDDLQTSPQQQVIDEAEIRSIVGEHIAGHRLADQVGADLSLYDVAAVMTGPDTMVDHFRCVPEIIDLSNRLSYGPKGKRLLPSRVREPGSLDPLVHVRVNGARRAGSGPNEAEVAVLVGEVARCHADPAYDGMDFGVVVVGTSPNAHIKALITRLLDTLGPSAMEERNIEIGTPSQFQGAERNVMFLSLVDVPPEGGRLRTWPHEHAGRNRTRVQQLNVAVSRARDQLWIFRSFDASALAPHDARSVILQAPPRETLSIEQELRKCDSKFERDVAMALADADPSLSIRAQVEAIGYSIDLVIEDEQGRRLAIECDGDRWHTSEERVRADLYRQRTLEDIGWRFERFLASEWYDDPKRRTIAILEHLGSLEPEQTAAVPSVSVAAAVVDQAPARHDGESEPLDEVSADNGLSSVETRIGDGAQRVRRAPTEDGAPPHDSTDHAAGGPDDDEGMSSSAPKGRSLFSRDIRVEAEQPLQRPAPSAVAVTRETNRVLAKAMRDRGVEPNGAPWQRAKEMIKDGATINEAADASAVGVETLTCETCGATWQRRLTRGRKPRFCPDCR